MAACASAWKLHTQSTAPEVGSLDDRPMHQRGGAEYIQYVRVSACYMYIYMWIRMCMLHA